MTLTFFWTDIFIWGLVITLLLLRQVVGRSPQVQQQWQAIFQSKIAMISAIILLCYVGIALLDSIHFFIKTAQNQPGLGEIRSALDLLMPHLANVTERTYSAPFALTEFNKSIQILPNGQTVFQFKALQHVHPVSLWVISMQALGMTVVISALLILSHRFYRKITKASSNVLPYKTAYATLAVLILMIAWMSLASAHYHIFGTDKVGEDVLYNTVKSIRTGILIGVLTTLVTLPLAIFLGISAGLFRGWVDDIIQYIYTTLNSIPGVLLIAAAVLVMQVMMTTHADAFPSTEERADMRLLFLIFILGLTSWTGLCRLLRAETLKVSQIDFVTAARAFGVSQWRLIVKHILPNLMHIILISVVLDFSGLVLAEAVLSYIGIGVDPTMHSWGNMINQARLEMARDPMVWWSLLSAFIFMFTLVLAANLFSDRVQFVLNPRNNQ